MSSGERRQKVRKRRPRPAAKRPVNAARPPATPPRASVGLRPKSTSDAGLQLEICDQGRPRTPPALIRRVVAATLRFAGQPQKSVSLLLTDDAGIAALHGAFLGDPTSTDVMSFDVDGSAEIVLSVQTARAVARASGHAPQAEIALYIVHGLLHTLGYDDREKRARQRMRVAERTVLQQLGIVVAAVD